MGRHDAARGRCCHRGCAHWRSKGMIETPSSRLIRTCVFACESARTRFSHRIVHDINQGHYQHSTLPGGRHAGKEEDDEKESNNAS